MSKISVSVNRQTRLELLRARSAVEREALVQGVSNLAVSLSPSRMVRGLMPGLNSGNAPRLACKVFSLMRHYPFVMSTLSAVFFRGKRSRVLKLAVAAGAGWQAYAAWRARKAAPASFTNPGPSKSYRSSL